jgi:hypothetical protein
MNYFSHFVVDHHPNNYEYNTGLFLPDVTKSWVKTFRHPEPDSNFSVHQHELLKGCLKHYHSDKLFHGSDFFKKYYQALNTEIKSAGLSDRVERKWFISHIMLELLIDRVIVKAYPTLLDAFYESLEKVDHDNLRSFLKYYGMKKDDEFFRFFNHFREVRYIYYYTDNNKFIYSLNRIMMRVNIAELSESDGTILQQVLLSFEEKYFNRATVMLDELKAVFK